MSAAHKWGHDELMRDLAGYLNGPEVMVWTDMQLGPSGSPRPDVYTLRKSYSKPIPLAFECKVSRSDLRSDTTSGKWQSYAPYASGIVFAVPDGLCTVADIPDGCGLIVRKEAVWRYARRPTLQKVAPPFDACMKLLIDGVSRTYREREPTPRTITAWAVNERVRKKFGEDVALAARDLHAARQRAENMKESADYEWSVARKRIALQEEALRKKMESERPEIESARADLCDELGLGRDASIYAIRRRISELRLECSADERVHRAERSLENVRRNIEALLRALPAANEGEAA